MKNATDTLINHVHTTKEFFTIDLYTLTVNIDGTDTVLRLCDGPKDVVVENLTYYAGKGIIERTQTKLTNELSVDSVTFSLYLAGDIFGDVGDLQKAAHEGILDHSMFALARAYYGVTDNVYVGKLDLFEGDCQVVAAGGLLLQLKASSDAVSLNLDFPVRKFYPQASYVTNSSGKVVYSEGDNNRSCMIPLKPNKRALL